MITLNKSINYQNFLIVKEKILSSNPNIMDLSDNNLYKFLPFSNLKNIIQEFDASNYQYHKNGKVHRCHLVEDWLRYFNIDQKYKKNIGFSTGVRESFSLLCSLDKFKFKKWLIPEDVYPFYQKTLNSKFIATATYPTLLRENPPFYYTNNSDNLSLFNEADVILITLPVKPLGLGGDINGLNNLKQLINNNMEKTFIIDCVYLQSSFNNITDNIISNKSESINYLIELYDLGNVYLLNSLSKNWSMPNTMGITFIPHRDLEIRELFKTINVSEEQLKLSYLALNQYTLIPPFISLYFMELRKRFDIYWQNKFHYSFFKNLELGNNHIGNISINESYLYFIKIEPEILLEENILSIPASVFGAKSGSVISILNKDLEKIHID